MARKGKKSKDGSNGSEPQFNKGDWIVHISHGIGKIVRVENKLVRGKNGRQRILDSGWRRRERPSTANRQSQEV
jgi:transcription-repair coupling factor (superfamily II helicase)